MTELIDVSCQHENSRSYLTHATPVSRFDDLKLSIHKAVPALRDKA